MSEPQSTVALGLWPLAGITTIGVTRKDAEATLATAIDHGITTFDTAYSYGYQGESDLLLSRFLGRHRHRYRIISKVGQRWTNQKVRVINGRPDQLTLDAETILTRLGIESLDLLMLHSPDPNLPIEESTRALCKLHQRGLCGSIGACNLSVDQLTRVHQVASEECTPVAAIQCPLNVMQREAQEDIIRNAHRIGIHAHVYWTLMKGLLAGRIQRDHQFQQGDSRPSYEIFQGEPRERAHRIVDAFSKLSKEINSSPARLAIGWALSQPGVEHALVGARYPEQASEIAKARPLDSEILNRVEQITTEMT